MKLTNVLIASALLVTLGVSGCTTTEYVHVNPQCTPPPLPVLPVVDMGNTWEKLGDAHYRQLERYINRLWAAYDEQAAMLEGLCNGA